MFDDFAEDFAGELFALVVSEHGNLQFLFMSEPGVVVHLASQECVGFGLDGLGEEEVTGTTADDNRLHGAFQQLVVLQGFYSESLLDSLEECQGVLGLGQIAQDPIASLHRAGSHGHGTCIQQLYVDESQLFGDAEIHPIFHAVQVGVGGIDAEVVLDGHAQAALDEVGVTHLLDTVEEQWVVTNYQVAAEIHGLAQHFLGYV